ncbi:MAG: restriction endonuclease subunit S [Candidatus Sericytochromatia bacterium]|nr:restriction endonuclease subunit S [Candidatus Sericytochromatia bacterium]
MMKSWVEKTIGQICDLSGGEVKTGPFGSQLHQSDYQESGTPVVMPTNIINGKIDVDKIARVSENHVNRLFKHKLSVGDIIYGRRGDIGRQALIRKENKNWLCGTGCLRISLGNGLVDPKFLHNYLMLNGVVSWIQNQAIGATMPNLNTKILRSVSVKFPSEIKHQKKIVAILSAYDDLIENNTRRIALLERMAEELYKEWFVRMRFPGHEQTRFVKGIPEGWSVKELEQIIDDIIDYRGVTPGKLGGDWSEHGCPALSALNVKNGRLIKLDQSKHVDEKMFEKWMRKKLKKFDILLTSEAPLGELYILLKDEKYVLSQRLFSIRANSDLISPLYLYSYLQSQSGQYELTSKGTGSTVSGIRQALLRQIHILTPSKPVMEKFDEQMLSFLSQKETLILASKILSQTRDRLLTRLISGKLSVEDRDIAFPPSMLEDEMVQQAVAQKALEPVL